MHRSMFALAVAGVLSVPAAAQTQAATAASPTEQLQPKIVKKTVCKADDEDTGSRIVRRVCKTIEVPAKEGASSKDATSADAAGGQ